MHGKYQKLVDSTEGFVREWEGGDTDIRHYISKLKEALDELEPYKWLSMDWDGQNTVLICVEKPCVYKSKYFAEGHDEYAKFVNGPEWINPGQLWERKYSVNRVHSPCTEGLKDWNGYWWKLVEDNSKRCENCAHYYTGPYGSSNIKLCWKQKQINALNCNGKSWQAR